MPINVTEILQSDRGISVENGCKGIWFSVVTGILKTHSAPRAFPEPDDES